MAPLHTHVLCAPPRCCDAPSRLLCITHSTLHTTLSCQVGQLQRMVGFLLEGGSSREEVLELMATSL